MPQLLAAYMVSLVSINQLISLRAILNNEYCALVLCETLHYETYWIKANFRNVTLNMSTPPSKQQLDSLTRIKTNDIMGLHFIVSKLPSAVG